MGGAGEGRWEGRVCQGSGDKGRGVNGGRG